MLDGKSVPVFRRGVEGRSRVPSRRGGTQAGLVPCLCFLLLAPRGGLVPALTNTSLDAVQLGDARAPKRFPDFAAGPSVH